MPRSRVYLPKLESPPTTLLEHLAKVFPHVSSVAWRDRMARGLITNSDGGILREDSPYLHGSTVFYSREVPSEPAPLEVEAILYRDDQLLAADKPHGMTVTPAGDHVARSLLNRLHDSTGIEELVPLHRLDRDTAGVVLFGITPSSRACYHALFANRAVEREYLAIARVSEPPIVTRWSVTNRVGGGTPWFRQEVARDGPPNAITEIELVEIRENLGLFRLLPRTGKKHQLRVHMASIGFPILGDSLYPEMRRAEVSHMKLQLLAYRLAFTDPITRLPRVFRSSRQLEAFPTY